MTSTFFVRQVRSWGANSKDIAAGGRVNGIVIVLVGLCAMVLSLLVSVTPASALQRTNTFNFGLDGTSSTSFNGEVTSAAFDQTNNHFYTRTFNKVNGFAVPAPGTVTPLGPPFPYTERQGPLAGTSGLAVDNTGSAIDGRLYGAPGNELVITAHNPDGTSVGAPFPIAPPSPFTSCGLAVDSSGNIFAANSNANGVAAGRGIFRYTSDGVQLPSIDTSTHSGVPCRLAVDGSDNLYVATTEGATEGTGRVWKYTKSSNYTSASVVDEEPANGVAVDMDTGHVFVAHKERVSEYDTNGTLLGEFGNEPGTSATKRFRGVAVDEDTNEVFVTDSNTSASLTKVRVFSAPQAVKPEAVTNPATSVARSEASLNGEVDPAGGAGITECEFQWGTTTAYANSTPCVPAASVGTPITSPTSVSANLSVTPETRYHFRILATSADGTTVGADRTFRTIPAVKETVTGAATAITQTSATLNGSFNADGINTTYYFEYGPTTTYGSKVPLPAPPGAPGGNAPASTPVSQNVTGLEPSTSPAGKLYNYRIAAVNSFGTTFGENKTFNTLPAVKALATLPATDIKHDSVTLNGTFDPNGEPTQYYFQWGLTAEYNHYAPVEPPGADGGETFGPKTVSAVIGNLNTAVNYHYRLVATNSRGMTLGADLTVVPNEEPTVKVDRVTEINTDTAVLEGIVNPNGLETTYHWEVGAEDCATIECGPTPETSIGSGVKNVRITYPLEGLMPGATYHFRLVTKNSRGEVVGEDHPFTTYVKESGIDRCANVLVRKQTGAGALAHCRAYELVSAASAGGYDVESNLIAGLEPMPGFPFADGKVLYTLRYGAVPGSGNPTNRGGDPYIATRGANGWTTEYVGLQADGTESAVPFSSTLLEADHRLSSFAFGGPEICDPCFSDGSTNIPLRLPNGGLVKGMAGSENPAADPAGEIVKRFSADGSHFVFGSTKRFEPSGNEGSLSIYDRDLSTNTTQVVSTLPNGTTMPGTGLEQLDISADGSRILIGRLVGTDTAGNSYYDLYMHVGTDPKSVLVADTAGGVLYSGMNADGSKVYFTTSDSLAGDSDAGADLFRADVTPAAATVTRVSTGSGGTGDVNGCNPVSNADGNHWNAPGSASAATCGVVAIAGGGGVASGDGTIYFLSPEKLDGANGSANQPNLYAAVPGSQPAFVTTLDPDDVAVRHGVAQAGVRDTADFQVTPDGRYTAFASGLRLTEATTGGFGEIYRTDLRGPIECASCAPTNGAPSSDTELTAGGLNLVDDGRVFFTSAEQLILRDTNQLKDAYEWDEGQVALISTGLDTGDSALLTASADGRDAFFFTRQSLAPQDENGGTMKIYDAREGGGFLYNPPPRECVASDECHGPGTEQPPPPPINSIEGTGKPQPPRTQGIKRCRKGRVKRHGKCEKRHRNQGKHNRHGKRHGQGKGAQDD